MYLSKNIGDFMKLNLKKNFHSLAILGTLCIPVIATAGSFDCTIVETGEIFKVEELTGLTRILWANGDKTFVELKTVQTHENSGGCYERFAVQKNYLSSNVHLSLENSIFRGQVGTRCVGAGYGYGKQASGLMKKNDQEPMKVICDSDLGLGPYSL